MFVKNLEQNKNLDDEEPAGRRARIVAMPESPEIQQEELNDGSYETDYFNVEDRSVMKILDLLGGHKGKAETRFHAKVEDLLTKEIVFDEVMSAPGTSKEDALTKLATHGLEARSKYMVHFVERLEPVREATDLVKDVLNKATVHVKTMFKDKFFPN